MVGCTGSGEIVRGQYLGFGGGVGVLAITAGPYRRFGVASARDLEGNLDEAFWDQSMRHPFGLLQPDGTHVIRMARARTARGGLAIQGCVPPVGSAVQIMGGSGDALLGVADQVVGAALASHPGAGVLLTFSCAARALILGPRAPEEPARLQAAAGAVPTFGFYCCGEFARTSGVLGTHHATLTAVAL